jgi:hypothetical protein
MKTLITTIALTLAATSASAYTCKNTVSWVDGQWSYTSSQCGNQAPASADTLAMITYIANNPPKDLVEDDVVAIIVDDVVVPLTREERIQLRLDNLTTRNQTLMARLVKLGIKFDGSNPEKAAKKFNKYTKLIVVNKTWKANKARTQAFNLSNYNNWSTKARIRGSQISSKMMDNHIKKNDLKAKLNNLKNKKVSK